MPMNFFRFRYFFFYINELPNIRQAE